MIVEDKSNSHVLVQILEARCVVREAVTRICSSSVAKENALHLSGKVCGHLRVVLHNIGIAGVFIALSVMIRRKLNLVKCHLTSNQDELALWKRLEDLCEQELSNRQSSRDIAEVEWAIIEAPTRVR